MVAAFGRHPETKEDRHPEGAVPEAEDGAEDRVRLAPADDLRVDPGVLGATPLKLAAAGFEYVARPLGALAPRQWNDEAVGGRHDRHRGGVLDSGFASDVVDDGPELEEAPPG